MGLEHSGSAKSYRDFAFVNESSEEFSTAGISSVGLQAPFKRSEGAVWATVLERATEKLVPLNAPVVDTTCPYTSRALPLRVSSQTTR